MSRVIKRFVVGAALVAALATSGAAAMDDRLGVRPPQAREPVAAGGTVALAVTRQGGDGFEDAFPIETLPFADAGTTVGYANDYGYTCPVLTMAPDVMYVYVPETDVEIDIDTWGSSYDITIFVVRMLPDGNVVNVVCDGSYYYTQMLAYLGNVALTAGETYFIIVSGYYLDSGDYAIQVEESVPCSFFCEGEQEDEPPLIDGYLDAYNGGCYSPEYGSPIQWLEGNSVGSLVFCGLGGWYTYEGVVRRDTDWFAVDIGPSGVIEIDVLAEVDVDIFEVWPHDCETADVVQGSYSYHCEPGFLTVDGEPGSEIWLLVAVAWNDPSSWNPGSWPYRLEIAGLAPGETVVESATWGAVKTLFWE